MMTVLILITAKIVEGMAISDYRLLHERSAIGLSVFMTVAAGQYLLGLLLWCLVAKLIRHDLPWNIRAQHYILSSLIMVPFSVAQTIMLWNEHHIPPPVLIFLPKLCHLALFFTLVGKTQPSGSIAADFPRP